MDEAIDRAKRYLDAGADWIFPEALRTTEEFSQFADAVKAPLVANMTEFGKTPYLSVSEFSRLGEGYKLVIFPVTAFRVAMKAVRGALFELSRSGTQKGLLEKMLTRDDFNVLIDYLSAERQDKATSRKASRLLDNH